MLSKIAAGVAAGITSLLLQASLIGPLTFPLPVSLPALLVVLTAIYAGPGVGVGMGFGVGLLADLGSDHPAGVQALCWLAAGLTAGVLGGLLARRGYPVRPVAALAAGICALASSAATVMLTLLDSHGASLWLSGRDLLPTGGIDALLALALAPVVAAMLRAQGVRAPRQQPRMVGLGGA